MKKVRKKILNPTHDTEVSKNDFLKKKRYLNLQKKERGFINL